MAMKDNDLAKVAQLRAHIRKYNQGVLNPSPVLYWWHMHAVTMAASLWTCLSLTGD